MNKISRPVFFTLLAILVIAAVAAVLASGHFLPATDMHMVLFDEDLSDSFAGWMIAIPVVIFVGVVLTVVFAGVALAVVLAVGLALIIALLAILLAFAPVVLILAIPFLAIYGFVKLIQRDSARIAAAA